MDDYHIFPVNDIKEHVLEGTECSCNPTIEVAGASLIIIHNAWDFRELYEPGGILDGGTLDGKIFDP